MGKYSMLYDSKEFSKKYNYRKNDLGVYVKNGKTYFKIWAPISKKVELNLYKYGHPTSLGNGIYIGDDNPYITYEMNKSIKGTWKLEINEELYGVYYTYNIYNADITNYDVVDPYAKAVGLNGLRGCILNLKKLNPKGWIKNYKRPYKINEIVVYEMHIRDITMDKTWEGPENLRGTYLGVTYPFTKYEEGGICVATGFDHIKELGVNAVQLLPIFDHANDELSDTFNWGYNPQNYNALEGQYSTNPYEASVRIKEFKQMCLDFHKNGIEVIMDVVYNHMNNVAESSFDKIVPGYYFRYNDDDTLSDGSGCSNETASERYMVGKFISDSVVFWAKEYNLGGFRFDLMGLHDIKTMNKIAKRLHRIDENIKIYGEPWLGGASVLNEKKRSVTANYSKLKNVGIFNDVIRDQVKGSVFETKGGAWIQGEALPDIIIKNMNGCYFDNPKKQINYVSCHDNNTLRDKLFLTGIKNQRLGYASLVCEGIVLFSLGVSFMLQGEEILRSKPYIENGKTYLSHNSYNLSDLTNSCKWNEKIKYLDIFNKYKELIQINKEHPIFHYSSKEECQNYHILNEWCNDETIVVEVVKDENICDEWEKVIIIFTNRLARKRKTRYVLNEEYKVRYSSGYNDLKVGKTITGDVVLGQYSLVILSK